ECPAGEDPAADQFGNARSSRSRGAARGGADEGDLTGRRGGPRGGGRDGRPRWSRMRRMTSGSVRYAITRSRPPHPEQVRTSTAWERVSYCTSYRGGVASADRRGLRHDPVVWEHRTFYRHC